MRHPARRPAALLAAAAVAALVAVTGCGSDEPSEPPAAAPDLGRAPADLRWQQWQGVSLPVGRADGPARSDTAATGFSHTPQGAALAAIQHSVRVSLAPDGVWTTVAAQSLVAGPGKDEWVRSRVLVSVTGTDPESAPSIAGYRITDWNPQRAEITVYTTYPDDSALASDTVVTWTADDWRLLLPDPATRTVTQRDVPAIPGDIVRLEATS
ncbi:hypothetical protein ACWDO0_28320 [Nocardia rhamnosiphila]